MSGINVLSDSLKGGSGLDKTSGLKGKNAMNSLDDVSAEFAVMLSGLTNINADPIGQNPTIGQDLEAEKDPDSSGQNLGYGQFMLSVLSRPIGLGDLPAGKEANSGNGVNQGKLSLESNEVFGTKGITSQIPQGNNPGSSELDKYRQVIADLLVALSGKITDSSPEGAALVSERGTSQPQEMIKLIQDWLMVSEDVTKNVQATNQVISDLTINPKEVGNIEGYSSPLGAEFKNLDDEAQSKSVNTFNLSSRIEDPRQVIAKTVHDWIQGTDESPDGESNFSSIEKVIKPLIDFLTNEQSTRGREISTKVTSLLTVLNQMVNQVQETNIPREVVKEMLQANSNKPEAVFNQPKNTSHTSETIKGASEDTVLHSDFKQKLAEIDLLHSKPLKNLQGVNNEEGNKGDQADSSEFSGVKASHNQNLNQNVSIGSDAKIVTSNVADGKTVATPVWEQISNVLREQVSSRNRELKELDIQLHPADLGRIRIGLRWENGQVHLQVHASEAATGQILQNQLTELRNTLTNQGVNCGMLQMGQQGRDQQHNQNHQGDQFQRTNDSYTDQIENEEQFPVVNLPSQGELNNRVNVTA